MELSLYRKYRPQTFDDLVGQDHIKKTIENAVREGSLSHAYLFCGPRGTGKTTIARLLAKALLCEKGPTSEPDGTCDQCVEVAEGTHPDVHELDAASRTGVDAIREEIIGRVQFAPTQGKYKIYIIDEVHMLSTAAFNALLKTLEEPPEHVVFIMCTTHPHKVPDTIQSRCQRFDFHRIPDTKIADNLRMISESEGYEADKEALLRIASHALGGMRDAITTLEQLAAFTGGNITTEDVEELLGEADEEQIFLISKAIAQRNMIDCFEATAQLADSGMDIAQFTKDLTAHMRDLYVIVLSGGAEGVVDADAKKITRLKALAKEYKSADRLARSLEVLGDLSRELRDAVDPRLRLEIALVRLARPQGDITLEALAERVDALESGVMIGGAAAPSVSTAAAAVREVRAEPKPEEKAEQSLPPIKESHPDIPKGVEPAKEESSPAPVKEATSQEAVPSQDGSQKPLDIAAARRGWESAKAEMKRQKPSRGAMFEGTSIEIDVDGTLLILFPSEQSFSAKQINERAEFRDFIDGILTQVFGRKVAFRATAGKSSTTIPEYPVPTMTPEVVEALDAPEKEAAEEPVAAVGEPAAAKEVPAETPAVTPSPAPASTEENSSGDASDISAMLAAGFGDNVVIEEEITSEEEK